jgi:hypothetical protein
MLFGLRILFFFFNSAPLRFVLKKGSHRAVDAGSSRALSNQIVNAVVKAYFKVNAVIHCQG